MGKAEPRYFHDSNLFFLPSSVSHVFNGVTEPRDYAPPAGSAIYISPTYTQTQREKILAAYPMRVPMEALRGWKRLTGEFLHHEMATDLELRRSHQEKAYELYFQQARGNIRVQADAETEPEHGFLRRVALPLLLLREDQEKLTINGLPVKDYMTKMGWDKPKLKLHQPPRSAKVYAFPVRALAAV